MSNKLEVVPEEAFAAIDESDKGHILIDELISFLERNNMYPAQKNLQLVFDHFDKDGSGRIDFDEFVAGITPFLSGVKDFWDSAFLKMIKFLKFI